MGRKRISTIWTTLTSAELQHLLDQSDSLTAVIRTFGLDPYNGNHKTLNQRIKEENLSLDKLAVNRKLKQSEQLKARALPNSKVFCEHSSYNRTHLKSRITKQTLIPYKCKHCSLDSTWNGKPLSLQLEHINGINNDNRLTNLCFLCPNCHSQTKTFAGKRNKRKCIKCKIVQVKHKKGKYCEECLKTVKTQNRIKSRKFNPTKVELEATLVRLNFNLRAIGRHYLVSDAAIKKRCKRMGIKYKKPIPTK